MAAQEKVRMDDEEQNMQGQRLNDTDQETE